MELFPIIKHEYFLINLSPDLFINSSIAILIVFFCYFSKIIGKLEFILFLLSIFTVFVAPILLPMNYLNDQFSYTNFVRELKLGIVPGTGRITLNASYIYSLFPLPSPSSLASLGMYNKIILIIVLIYLRSKNI